MLGRRYFAWLGCAVVGACVGSGGNAPPVGSITPSALPPVVLASRWLPGPAAASAGCVRIASPSELRRLGDAWGGAASLSNDGFVDFAHEALVLVDLGADGGAFVDLVLSEEEGVDVVQVVRAAADGAPQPAVLALAVARRPCQLAVILRQRTSDGPGVERTLAVFARD